MTESNWYVLADERQRLQDTKHRVEEADPPDQLGRQEDAKDDAVQVRHRAKVHFGLLQTPDPARVLCLVPQTRQLHRFRRHGEWFPYRLFSSRHVRSDIECFRECTVCGRGTACESTNGMTSEGEAVHKLLGNK
jgi:hypothetical protein